MKAFPCSCVCSSCVCSCVCSFLALLSTICLFKKKNRERERKNYKLARAKALEEEGGEKLRLLFRFPLLLAFKTCATRMVYFIPAQPRAAHPSEPLPIALRRCVFSPLAPRGGRRRSRRTRRGVSSSSSFSLFRVGTEARRKRRLHHINADSHICRPAHSSNSSVILPSRTDL